MSSLPMNQPAFAATTARIALAALTLLFVACDTEPEFDLSTSEGQIRALVASVRRAPVLSQAVLEEIFQTPFTPHQEKEHWVSLEARPSGPFDWVEFRHSRSEPWRLVVLNVRPGVNVSYHALRGALIPPSVAPTSNPHVPAEFEHSFIVTDTQPAQELHFSFPRTGNRLTGVAFHRDFD